MTAVFGNAPPARASHYAEVPEGVPELVSLWDPPYGTTRSRSPTGCRRPERSSAGCRSGRPAEAPLGRTRCIRCIGTTSARASSRSEGARAPSLSQRGRSSSAGGSGRGDPLLSSRGPARGVDRRGRGVRSVPNGGAARARTHRVRTRGNRDEPTSRVRKEAYPLLSTSNLYRVGGLAASPGSCRIIAGRHESRRAGSH
jgi:hypothetical protein